MTILEQIDALAASVNKMTIKRAKHFCNLYEALYVVICVPEVDANDYRIIEARMQKIRMLRDSIKDYEAGKAITLSKALEMLGDINET